MMKPVDRIDGSEADPSVGVPVLDAAKVSWNGAMFLGTLLGIWQFSFSGFALFIVLTWVTLLIGHSVGMHRLMIHRTFRSPRWFERILIYIGTLVGVSGPFGIIAIHDMRDWAQRQPRCHEFFAHRRSFWRDLTWNLFYRFEFALPPQITIEPHFADDAFYRFLDASWRWHQIPVAAALYGLGGWTFVLWGVCARVFVSTAGHWSVTYFCHNPGPGRWRVKGASVQASNLRGMGLITYGECWHNNHHAFPESARIGLEPGQTDPGWWFISKLELLGLAFDVSQPRPVNKRTDLSVMEPIENDYRSSS